MSDAGRNPRTRKQKERGGAKCDSIGAQASRTPGNKQRIRQVTSSPSIAHFDAPLQLRGWRVEADWIDYNGHMNVAWYVAMFDQSLARVLNMLGCGSETIAATGGSCFTLESHIRYLRELREGAAVRIEFQLLEADHKRLHYYQRMFHDGDEADGGGFLAATCEDINMHVDMNARRSAPFPPAAAERVAALLAAHAGLETPETRLRPLPPAKE